MTTNWANSCVMVLQPKQQATLRLFCFPYAGGGATLFNTWPSALSDAVEVCAIQLPGRENRLHETPVTEWPVLLEQLTAELEVWLDKPFALFGHSMGALLAFAVAQHLRPRFEPVHLFVSACPAPGMPQPPALHGLSDEDFVTAIQARYQNIPESILQQPEMMALFLPSLRADFTLYGTYSADTTPLACPITVFGGLQDHLINREHLTAWRVQTTGRFALRMFPGAHFFLKTAQAPLLQTIGQTLTLR